MRLASKTESAGCLSPSVNISNPYIHGTSLPPLRSRSTDPNRDLAARLTREPMLRSSNPLYPTHFPKTCSITTLQQHTTPRPCCLAYAPRATSIYKAFSFIHCQWSFLWIYRLCLGLCMSVSFAVCHALTPCSLCHDPPPTFFFFLWKICPRNTDHKQPFQACSVSQYQTVETEGEV